MATKFELNNAYLNVLRDKIKDDISYARVRFATTWYNVNVSSVRVLSDGRVECKFIMNRSASASTTVASEMKLCMADGTEIGTYKVAVECKVGTLFTVRFNVFQAKEV